MLNVKVISPQKILFDGEADHVLVPGLKGILGIFSGHTPLYAEVTTGEIEVMGKEPLSFPVQSGILKVRKDQVILLIGL